MLFVEFEFEVDGGIFRDCIALEDDHTHTSEDIEQMKQDRLQAYMDMVNTKKPDTDLPVQEQLNG